MSMFDKVIAKNAARVKSLEWEVEKEKRQNARCQAVIRSQNKTIKALKAIVLKAKLKGPSELLVELQRMPIDEFTCEGCAALQKELDHTKEALNDSGRELASLKQFQEDVNPS